MIESRINYRAPVFVLSKFQTKLIYVVVFSAFLKKTLNSIYYNRRRENTKRKV